MLALDRANEIRFARARRKREIFAGTLTIADALTLPELQGMLVQELLMAQRRWGLARANRLLLGAGCTQMRRVEALTARQRALIVAGT